jgi:dipeptidyl aminopeptidase/acylaminoacyl peptidase
MVAEGRADLFVVDLETEEVTQLTDDRYTVQQPAFSPDGRTLAFVTDRGPGTDFERLTFGPKAIGLMDLETRRIERLAPLGDADHWNPQFTPDGRGLFFLADPDGFRDIYRVDLEDGELWRVTQLATGVSGITPASPALTVAPGAGTAAFSVFDGSEYHVYALDAVAAAGDRVDADEVIVAEGRRLPGPPPRGSCHTSWPAHLGSANSFQDRGRSLSGTSRVLIIAVNWFSDLTKIFPKSEGSG